MTEALVLHADRREPAAPENRATRQRGVVHILESPNDRSDGIFEDTMWEATGYPAACGFVQFWEVYRSNRE